MQYHPRRLRRLRRAWPLTHCSGGRPSDRGRRGGLRGPTDRKRHGPGSRGYRLDPGRWPSDGRRERCHRERHDPPERAGHPRWRLRSGVGGLRYLRWRHDHTGTVRHAVTVENGRGIYIANTFDNVIRDNFVARNHGGGIGLGSDTWQNRIDHNRIVQPRGRGSQSIRDAARTPAIGR